MSSMLYKILNLGGARLKTVACPSRESGREGVCIALAGNFPREVMYITLQEVFWIVSIGWIIIQAWDRFRKKK